MNASWKTRRSRAKTRLRSMVERTQRSMRWTSRSMGCALMPRSADSLLANVASAAKLATRSAGIFSLSL